MELPAARMESESGSHQLGKYRLVATLGQGGMGTVYLALATGLGQFRKLLVVKELRQDLTRRESFVRMFMDEARLAARLDHPNVVQTFEASQQDARYFLAMEYLDGQPLNALIHRLAKSRGLPLWMHIQILCEVLTGLHYAHELRDYDGSSLHVVHRDVSPQNVFVTYHGQVKVVDFGVAKAAGANTLTDPGVFKGKFAYAAPEQILGRPVDARSDVFAVGIMLWQAIAGQRFSERVATPEAFRVRAAGEERRIAQVVPTIDPLLAEICDKALALDPDDRFESAEAFRADLQEYLLLSGVRIEASEIGQLMRDVFEQERRDIHRLIEQSMKHRALPTSSQALPLLRGDNDKMITTLADLSNLIDVSMESDDAKIRQGYAHSRITPLLPEPSPPPPAAWGSQSIAANRWVIASMALSAACLIALLSLLLSPRRVVVETSASAAQASPFEATTPRDRRADPGAKPMATQAEQASLRSVLTASNFENAIDDKRGPMKRRVSATPRRDKGEHAAVGGNESRVTSMPSVQSLRKKAGNAVEVGGDLRALKRGRDVSIDEEYPSP